MSNVKLNNIKCPFCKSKLTQPNNEITNWFYCYNHNPVEVSIKMNLSNNIQQIYYSFHINENIFNVYDSFETNKTHIFTSGIYIDRFHYSNRINNLTPDNIINKFITILNFS